MRKALSCALILFLHSASPIPAGAQGGWYLVLPPVNESEQKAFWKDLDDPAFSRKRGFPVVELPGRFLRDSAPLSQWTQVRGYDTADACERERQAGKQHFMNLSMDIVNSNG